MRYCLALDLKDDPELIAPYAEKYFEAVPRKGRAAS